MILPAIRRFASTAPSVKFRQPMIAVFSGSCRKGGINTKLAEQVAMQLGTKTKYVDMGSYEIPLYNQDLESASGMPPAAIDLKSTLADADGWIVASPEYNGFVTPLLLNAFTWCSRGDPSGEIFSTFKGKSAVVISASPGIMGGMRSLNPNRQLLQNLGVNVLPESVAIGGAFKSFDEATWSLIDEKQKAMLQNAVESLFYQTRDRANRDPTCKIIKAHVVGEYGAVDVAK